MSILINVAATRQYCLHVAKQERSGWEFTRVSREFLDNLDYWLASHLRECTRDLSLLRPGKEHSPKLIVWKTCQRQFETLLHDKVDLLIIDGVRPPVMWDLEQRLKDKIKALVSRLPSVGKTIK